jgi:hypothetical protein
LVRMLVLMLAMFNVKANVPSGSGNRLSPPSVSLILRLVD